MPSGFSFDLVDEEDQEEYTTEPHEEAQDYSGDGRQANGMPPTHHSFVELVRGIRKVIYF